MFYDPNHYTLDLIPEYRRQTIDNKVEYVIEKYNIKHPLDCVQLMKKITSQNQVIVKTCGVHFKKSSKFEAEARYYHEEDTYILFYNLDKVHYPFEKSHHRRLNFTLAHEIGHIVLGHLKVINPTKEQIEMFETEADEFAGRLLMPEDLILEYANNFEDPYEIAEIFLVSARALWKRLNNLKMLELLYNESNYAIDLDSLIDSMDDVIQSVEFDAYSEIAASKNNTNFRLCEVCGNIEISIDANFCNQCGHWLHSSIFLK